MIDVEEALKMVPENTFEIHRTLPNFGKVLDTKVCPFEVENILGWKGPLEVERINPAHLYYSKWRDRQGG